MSTAGSLDCTHIVLDAQKLKQLDFEIHERQNVVTAEVCFPITVTVHYAKSVLLALTDRPVVAVVLGEHPDGRLRR